MGDSWGPNDLSPEEEKALGIATVVASFGFMAYLTYSALTVDYDYDVEVSNQRTLEFTNFLREQDAAKKAEEAEEAERKKAKEKAWASDMLDRLDAGETPWNEKNRALYESTICSD